MSALLSQSDVCEERSEPVRAPVDSITDFKEPVTMELLSH